MLIEWDGGEVINLNKIIRVYKGEQYDAHKDKTFPVVFVSLEGGFENYAKYETKLERNNGYDRIVSLIKEVTNLDVDKSGAFICSHCGAPNT